MGWNLYGDHNRMKFYFWNVCLVEAKDTKWSGKVEVVQLVTELTVRQLNYMFGCTQCSANSGSELVSILYIKKHFCELWPWIIFFLDMELVKIFHNFVAMMSILVRFMQIFNSLRICPRVTQFLWLNLLDL